MIVYNFFKLLPENASKHGHTQTHRHTDTNTHRHIDTPTHRHTHKHTHRHIVVPKNSQYVA